MPDQIDRMSEDLSSTEDLARQPDGVPHIIVADTLLLSILDAVLIAALFLSGRLAAQIAAGVLAFIATPLMVMLLVRKADRERDHLHPSR